jgi:hypothetical protein
MDAIRDRIADSDDDDGLAARISQGDTTVKPGASGSRIALEDVDEDSPRSAVDAAGDPEFTDGTGNRVESRRRLIGDTQPLQTTGSVGTRERVRPSKRVQTEAKAESEPTRRSSSKARTKRSKSS